MSAGTPLTRASISFAKAFLTKVDGLPGHKRVHARLQRAMPGNDDRNRYYTRLNDPGPMNPLDSEPKSPPPSEPRMPPPREAPPVIGRNASGKSDNGLNGVDVVCVLEPV